MATTAPTASAAPRITPDEADRLLRAGQAWIVDVRETDEHRREHVAGATLTPSSAFSAASFPAARPGMRTMILCQSGNRAGRVADALAAAGRTDVVCITGGLRNWATCGLPVERNAKAPIPLMRQVMITVGILVLACSALAWFVSPLFLAGTAFLGAGLLFSGATGICAMASVLSKMPWNKIATSKPAAANCCSKAA